jgi:hypothetical protein
MADISTDYKIFDVVPGPDDSWGILYDGRALTLHGEKKSAVKLARTMAIQNRPSRLVVRAADGDIESETPFEPENCNRSGAIEPAETHDSSPGEETV